MRFSSTKKNPASDLDLPSAENISRPQSRRKLLTLMFLAIILCIAVIIHFALNSFIQKEPEPLTINIPDSSKQDKTKLPGFPLRLKIPKINIDTSFDYISLTPQGDLGAPKGPTSVGWYDRGPRPGEVGSSVIDGHFGYKDNIPAVFDNLNKLQKGDNLYVEDENGVTTTFVVREFRTYNPSEDATSIFRSSDGKAHLNLITCNGVWNNTSKSYSKRLVVFADKAI